MKIVKLISFFCFLAVLFTACHKNKAGDEIASVTPEELRTLFRFDTQKDVYENLQSLNSFDKEKPYQIKGKTIVISQLTPEDIDALQGSFNLTVAGTVNRTPFQETLAFKGFKKKIRNREAERKTIPSLRKNSEVFSFSIPAKRLPWHLPAWNSSREKNRLTTNRYSLMRYAYKSRMRSSVLSRLS